jgi:hypothetical protein
VDSCTGTQTLGEGTNLTATGAATGTAGNSATASVTGVNVDKTAPALTGTPSTTGVEPRGRHGHVDLHRRQFRRGRVAVTEHRHR